MSAPLGEPQMQTAPFNTAAIELARGMASVGHAAPTVVVEALARRTIRAYLKHARAIREPKHNTAPETRMLAAMAIGEVQEFPPADNSLYRSRMITARKLMENPDATWRVLRHRDGQPVRIKRIHDGQRDYKATPDNPRAVFLAALPVGLPTFTDLFERRIEMWYKLTARRILGSDDANWRLQCVQGRARVTRLR